MQRTLFKFFFCLTPLLIAYPLKAALLTLQPSPSQKSLTLAKEIKKLELRTPDQIRLMPNYEYLLESKKSKYNISLMQDIHKAELLAIYKRLQQTSQRNKLLKQQIRKLQLMNQNPHSRKEKSTAATLVTLSQKSSNLLGTI